MKKTFAFMTLTSSILFAASGVELTQKHCASCHMLTTPKPEMIPELKAPAMDAVMYHIGLEMQDKKMIKDFIIDYVQNPDASKSVCESNKVQNFGVMPSLKGKVSVNELEAIAEHMMATYPSKAFVGMITEIQRNDKLNGLLNSPFLINREELPHLTKLLIMHWDKKSLGLSQEQKNKLLIIRKETLEAAGKIKKEVTVLEDEIIELSVDDEPLEIIAAKVDALAKLKAGATKIQLKCLKESLKILNDKQIEYLLPFWDA